MSSPILPYQSSPPPPDRVGHSRLGLAALILFAIATSSISITREHTGCFNLSLFLIALLIAIAGITQRTRLRHLAFLALLLNSLGALAVFIWLMHLAEP